MGDTRRQGSMVPGPCAYMTEKGRTRYQPLLLEIETQQLFAVGNNVSYSCVCVCVYAYTPEKGGRKPALSPNLFVSVQKCRGSGHDRSYHPKRPLTIPYEQKPTPSAAPLEDFPLLCNPSPPLPQYHFSSPCKLSCSEPQRTLLSVELPPFSRCFYRFSFIFFRFFSNLFPAVPPLSSVFLLRNLP